MQILENGDLLLCWFLCLTPASSASLLAQMVKNLPANAGDADLVSGSGRSLGVGNGYPLQYPC